MIIFWNCFIQIQSFKWKNFIIVNFTTLNWRYLLKNFLQNWLWSWNSRLTYQKFTNKNIFFFYISKNSICTLRAYLDKKKYILLYCIYIKMIMFISSENINYFLYMKLITYLNTLNICQKLYDFQFFQTYLNFWSKNGI